MGRRPGRRDHRRELPDAIARFSALTETALAKLPDADRALERTRLLGSLVAPGIADRVFELEADTPGADRAAAARNPICAGRSTFRSWAA